MFLASFSKGAEKSMAYISDNPQTGSSNMKYNRIPPERTLRESKNLFALIKFRYMELYFMYAC